MFLFPTGVTPETFTCAHWRKDANPRRHDERIVQASSIVVVASDRSDGFCTAHGGSGCTSGRAIKIGFGVSLTGGLASAGKAHLLAMQIWAEKVNAKGGLLGRPVQIIYYDDQTNAANVPAISAKLLDIDKVDLLVGHATNLIVAALPMIIERKKMVMTLLAYASNAKLKYPRYFQSAPFGGDYGEISKNFFEVAKTIKPEPKTVALVGADAEFSNNVLTGARTNAPKYNLKIVYDR